MDQNQLAQQAKAIEAKLRAEQPELCAHLDAAPEGAAKVDAGKFGGVLPAPVSNVLQIVLTILETMHAGGLFAPAPAPKPGG